MSMNESPVLGFLEYPKPRKKQQSPPALAVDSTSKKKKVNTSSANRTKQHVILSPESPSNNEFQSFRIWRLLMGSVIKATDELYAFAEEDEDRALCAEAIELFERSKQDFSKLVERIESQQSFADGRSKSASWEIRKPSVNVDVLKSSKLNAFAQPFKPSQDLRTSGGIDRASISVSQQKLLNDSTASAKSPSTNMHLSPTKSKKPSPLVISTDERTTNTRSHSLSPRPKDHEKGKEVAKRKDFDLEEDSQLVLETESVWAKAEALVDAVSSAEEKAWRALLSGGDTSKSPSCELTNYSFSPSAVSTPTRSGLNFDAQGSSPISLASTSSTGAEKRRSLHDKLSSPDRKKVSQLSPEEVLQIYNAKISAAESNRDQAMLERKMKAAISSSRAKLIEQRHQRRKEKAEEIYSLKHRDAEKRHEEYIQSVRGKANNENAKVSEVIFINTLNAELLNEELQRQLNEVEERIRTASARRQDRLNDIASSNRQKNRKKVQQMSAVRFQMESQRMERWQKLQDRIEAVQMRRDARLYELAKRKESLLPEKKELEPAEKSLLRISIESTDNDTGIHFAKLSSEIKRKKKKKGKKSKILFPDSFPDTLQDLIESESAGGCSLFGIPEEDLRHESYLCELRRIKESIVLTNSTDVNVLLQDFLSFPIDCCNVKSMINSLTENSLSVKRLARSLSKPTNEALQYFVDHMGALVAQVGEGHAQAITRLTEFYTTLLPLVSAAGIYESSNAFPVTKKKSNITQTVLFFISRISLDTEFGILKHRSLLKLALDSKVISWICMLVVKFQDLSLLHSSELLVCIVNSFLVIVQSQGGNDESKDIELFLSTTVDIFRALNIYFPRLILPSTPEACSSKQVECTVAYPVAFANHIISALSATTNMTSRLVLEVSCFVEKKKLAYDYLFQSTKSIHYILKSALEFPSTDSLYSLPYDTIMSFLMSRLLLALRCFNAQHDASMKLDLIRFILLLLLDLNRLSVKMSSFTVLQELIFVDSNLSLNLIPMLQSSYVLLVEISSAISNPNNPQSADLIADAGSCCEEILFFFTKCALCNSNLVQHTSQFLPILCQSPLRFFTLEKLKYALFPALIACCYNVPEHLSRLRKELAPSQLSFFVSRTLEQGQSEAMNRLNAVIPQEFWREIINQIK